MNSPDCTPAPGDPPADRPRGPGRPSRAEAVFTPARRLELEKLWLTQTPWQKLKLHFGCGSTTLKREVRRIKDRLGAENTEERERLIAAFRYVAHVAYERFEASQTPQTKVSVKRQLQDALEASGNATKPAAALVERTFSKASTVGDAQWLSLHMQALEQIGRLTGAYPAKRIEAKVQQVAPVDGDAIRAAAAAVVKDPRAANYLGQRFAIPPVNGHPGTN